MEVTALCFRLLMLEFLLLETRVQSLDAQQNGAASLRITPDRLQFFDHESVSFNCEGTDGSAQLRGSRDDGAFTPACVMKRTSSASSCTAAALYPSDSGEYWCETEGGERSNSINITITGGSVILESPALPVMEGDTVTLRCRNKTTSTNLKAVFYKGNVTMNNSPTEEIRMNNVSRFVEGLYKCSIQGAGESPESRLTVTVSGAASLRITPDRLQFFELERVSFHCDGTDGYAQLRGSRDDGGFTPACIMERTSSGSCCRATALYPADSGEYWCETEGGERSNRINVIVTGGSVILESPALPVMEGDTVTLRCRNKMTSTNLKAVFYKDNVPMNKNPTEEIRMNKVSRFVEGLYKCSIQGAGESPESRLTVTELHRDTSRDTRLFSDNFIHVLLLMRIILTVVVMVLQLLLLARLHFGKLGRSPKKLDDRKTETS